MFSINFKKICSLCTDCPKLSGNVPTFWLSTTKARKFAAVLPKIQIENKIFEKSKIAAEMADML